MRQNQTVLVKRETRVKQVSGNEKKKKTFFRVLKEFNTYFCVLIDRLINLIYCLLNVCNVNVSH